LVYDSNNVKLGISVIDSLTRFVIGSPSRIRTRVVELLRQLSSDALEEMLRGKNTLARDLLSMLSEVRL
jgi:hypothetical protein